MPQHVKFSWPESERLNLEQAVALHVYRIAEEALSNSIKHAEADKITIELQALSRRRVALTITDNGKGFIQSSQDGGMGLQNMKYRAGAIGAELKITTAPGKGTIIRCTVPWAIQLPRERRTQAVDRLDTRETSAYPRETNQGS